MEPEKFNLNDFLLLKGYKIYLKVVEVKTLKICVVKLSSLLAPFLTKGTIPDSTRKF